MERIKLNSTIIGLGLFSTYHGYGDTEFVLSEDNIQYDFEECSTDITPSYYWQHFDNKEYMRVWNERVFNYIEDKLFKEIFKSLDINFSMLNLGYYSPKEYNFESDCCDFELEVDWDLFYQKVLNYTKDNIIEFNAYLKDNYSSYDGFMSFTANNDGDWLEDFKNKRVQEIAAALSFIIHKEYTYEEVKEDAIYDVFTELYYTEFVDYTELDKFLQNMSNPTEDWQIAIIERNKKLNND